MYAQIIDATEEECREGDDGDDELDCAGLVLANNSDIQRGHPQKIQSSLKVIE